MQKNLNWTSHIIMHCFPTASAGAEAALEEKLHAVSQERDEALFCANQLAMKLQERQAVNADSATSISLEAQQARRQAESGAQAELMSARKMIASLRE